MLLSPVQTTSNSAHAEIGIDAPVSATFAYITDLQNITTWWPEHTFYRRLSGNGGPGSTYAWVYQTKWIPLLGVSLVQKREPDRRFVYFVATPGIRVRFQYDFRAIGEGTLVTFAMRSFLLPPPISAAELTQAFERLGHILASQGQRGAAAA